MNYRFHGAYAWSKPFTKSFDTDEQALEFASGMDDGVWRTDVWKEIGGNWYAWDYENGIWVYDSVASSEL